MSTPILFMVKHRNEILDAFDKNQEKPKKTWSSLLEVLPELSNTMRFNTFKQYVKVFASSSYELNKVRQDLATVKQRLDKTKNRQAELDRVNQDLAEVTQKLDTVNNKNQALLAELIKVRQLGKVRERVIQRLDKHPKRISGWSVQKSKDGYFRCYRKIEGRVHCVYIGKDFNVEKAQKRIFEKENSLGLLN